jgi:hypothetical protein
MSIAAFDALIAEMKLSAEDGLSELKLQLIALKKERNALTPFAGAPNEIIVRIFVNLTHNLQSPDSFFFFFLRRRSAPLVDTGKSPWPYVLALVRSRCTRPSSGRLSMALRGTSGLQHA